MKAGEIDGYQFAVIEATNLIAVRRPDGSLRMLPGAVDVENAVKSFIREDRDGSSGQPGHGNNAERSRD
jgi:hypothetical protein